MINKLLLLSGLSPDWSHCVVFLGKILNSHSIYLHPMDQHTLYTYTPFVAEDNNLQNNQENFSVPSSSGWLARADKVK